MVNRFIRRVIFGTSVALVALAHDAAAGTVSEVVFGGYSRGYKQCGTRAAHAEPADRG